MRRIVLVATLVPVALIGTAVPASAHPTLLSTTPEAGYSVRSPPDRITLIFDEPVAVEPRGVRVVDDRGGPVGTSEVVTDDGGRCVAVRVLTELDAGRYVVRWRVTAQDGDVVDSAFDFAVATGTAGLRGRESAETTGFPLVVVLRWLFLLGLVVVLGGLVGERIAARTVPDAVRPRSLLQPAALVSLLAVTGLLIQLVVSSGGSRAVLLLGVQAGGLAAVAALGGDRRWWFVAVPLGVVIAAEALRNHLGTQRGVVGAVLIATHLIALAGWAGALVHLLRVARANLGGTKRAFAAYARLAVWLFVLVATTGTVAALLLVPDLDALIGTAYGRTLVVKLAIVAFVIGLAAVGRWRLSGVRRSPEQTARVEAAGLVAVVAASAVLVTLPTPAPATRDVGFPPTATGSVIRLGTLAGQVAVGVAASENQLEIRLRVPDDRVQVGEAEPPAYRVSARVSAPGESSAAVGLRPCGPGCFVGPVPWRAGANHVDLRVEAPGWHGGAVIFPIHWAPRIAPEMLARVRAAMIGQPVVRVVESVTSDTSRPEPRRQTVTLSGREFLDSEPYGSPPDPPSLVLRRFDGRTVLTFGLLAEGVHAELEIDASYRIIRETLAAPKHLTRRTFTYPR